MDENPRKKFKESTSDDTESPEPDADIPVITISPPLQTSGEVQQPSDHVILPMLPFPRRRSPMRSIFAASTIMEFDEKHKTTSFIQPELGANLPDITDEPPELEPSSSLSSSIAQVSEQIVKPSFIFEQQIIEQELREPRLFWLPGSPTYKSHFADSDAITTAPSNFSLPYYSEDQQTPDQATSLPTSSTFPQSLQSLSPRRQHTAPTALQHTIRLRVPSKESTSSSSTPSQPLSHSGSSSPTNPPLPTDPRFYIRRPITSSSSDSSSESEPISVEVSASVATLLYDFASMMIPTLPTHSHSVDDADKTHRLRCRQHRPSPDLLRSECRFPQWWAYDMIVNMAKTRRQMAYDKTFYGTLGGVLGLAILLACSAPSLIKFIIDNQKKQ